MQLVVWAKGTEATETERGQLVWATLILTHKDIGKAVL